MNGVQILYEYTEYSDINCFLLAWGIIAVLFGMILFISCLANHMWMWALLTVGVMIVVSVALTLIPKTDYLKVVLDDGTSFNEFTERYEITDTEGKILTVTERAE